MSAARTCFGRAESGGADNRTIAFTFATSDVGRDGHVILPGAWQSKGHDGLAAFRANPVFLFAHRTDEPPIGRVTAIAESGGVLKGAVRFATREQSPFADTIFRLYEGRFMNAASVSWSPLEYDRARDPARPGGLDFKKCELLEISAVPVPADAGALAEARSRGINTAPLAAWAARQLDERNYSAMPRATLESIERAARAEHAAARLRAVRPATQFQSLGEHLAAIAGAARHGARDARLVRAPTGANEADPTAGGFLIEEVWTQELIGSLYEQAVLAPLCDRRETDKPLASQKLPAIDETSRADGSRQGGALAYWSSEAAAVAASFPRFRNIEFTPHKLIAVAFATNELLADVPMLDAHLRRVFASEMGFKLDAAILSGSGAGVPLGVTSSTALVTVAKDAGQAAGTVTATNISGMWSRLALPCRRRAVWLANEDAMAQLDSGGFTGIFQPAGSAGNAAPLLKGRPVIEVEQANTLGTSGDIVLADLSQYILVDGGFRAMLSADVRFLNDEAVFRFTMRVDGKPAWASPVASWNGSATRSPFVALAAR